MNCLEELVTLDTNEFIFGLRRTPGYPACTELLFEKLPILNLYVPLQVLLELQRNLTNDEMRDVSLALNGARSVQIDYTPVKTELVHKWKARGVKKGDAVITAKLEEAKIAWLVSENRHFLSEISELPFQVLTSEQMVSLLAS